MSETQEKMVNVSKNLLLKLLEHAKPFLSSDVVDETRGTIPLMEDLKKAIEAIEERL